MLQRLAKDAAEDDEVLASCSARGGSRTGEAVDRSGKAVDTMWRDAGGRVDSAVARKGVGRKAVLEASLRVVGSA